MALGTNRDYKTNDRRVRKNLAKHKELMEKYVAEGLSHDKASKQAMEEVLHPRRKA